MKFNKLALILSVSLLPVSVLNGSNVSPQTGPTTGAIPDVSRMEVNFAPGGLMGLKVYPNPWRADRSSQPLITFEPIAPNCTVKIFTVSGRWIKTLYATGTTLTWDLTNESNESVASGLYFYLVSNTEGKPIRGTLTLIR